MRRRCKSQPAPVAVRAADGRFLAPCHPARARQLLRRGRAWFLSAAPLRIELTEPPTPERSKQP